MNYLNTFVILTALLPAAMATPAATNSVASVPISAIARGLEWRGVALEEKEFTLWDVSPIVGEDGKVHLFVGRWPEANVDPAWRKSSEIAHYVGEKPEGPFQFRNVVLRGTGTHSWDKFAPSQPRSPQSRGHLRLLYIANSDYHQPPHPFNQRIGMAVSSPWMGHGARSAVMAWSWKPHRTQTTGLTAARS